MKTVTLPARLALLVATLVALTGVAAQANTAIYVDIDQFALGTSTSTRPDQAYVNKRAYDNCRAAGGKHPASIYQGTSTWWFAVAGERSSRTMAIRIERSAALAEQNALAAARKMGARHPVVLKIFKGL